MDYWVPDLIRTGGLVRYDDLSSLYIFSKICTNAPGLVAATPQALPTKERPFSQ